MLIVSRLVKPSIIFFISTLILLGGTHAMSLEQPDYTVLYEEDGIEYRRYESFLVTETVIESEDNYKAAANEGFRRLFRYITGNNETQSDIAMTKPVQQVRSTEKISMTSPVQYEKSDSGYRVAFMLPAKYTLETAPVPLDSRLQTRAIPARTMAVLRYSGRWTNKNFIRYEAQLLDALEKSNVESSGEVKSAFYNAPFIPPFLRRNEVMIEVTDLPFSSPLANAQDLVLGN